MRLHILTVGSRGDIEPLAALGAGVRAAGHDVTVVSNVEGRIAAERAGLAFRDLRFSVRQLLGSPAGGSIVSGGSAHRSRAALVDAAVAALPEVGPRIVEASTDADAVVSTETLHLLARSIAERRGVPHVAASFAPYGRTRAYRSYYADDPTWRSVTDLETHDRVQRHHHGRFLPGVNGLRAGLLGLPPIGLEDAHAGREACPAVLGYSAAIAPPPSDWPSHRHVTGYWPTGDDRTPADPALADFVEAGAPPVYIGFGSMPYDVRRVAALVEAVTRRPGVRVVYATGWADASDLPRLPATVFVTQDAPHRWLFPRVRAAVHHGGAGTTGAALMAGTPSLIAWMIVDQVFWAERVASLGAGINLGRFEALDAEALGRALRRVGDDEALHERTRALGAIVRQEDGVAAGVAAIQRYIGAGAPGAAYGLSRTVERRGVPE